MTKTGLPCILICGEGVVLFGNLKGINDGEEEEEEEGPMVDVVGVELLLVLVLELVLELFGSLNGMRELLLVTVVLTVGLLELFELVTVGVTVEVNGLLDTDGKWLKNMTVIKGSGQIGPPNVGPHIFQVNVKCKK